MNRLYSRLKAHLNVEIQIVKMYWPCWGSYESEEVTCNHATTATECVWAVGWETIKRGEDVWKGEWRIIWD